MQEFRDYLEIAYFISGIIVAIAAVFALYQLKIAKDSIKIQSKREALSLTVSQCNYYSSTILKLQDTLYEKRVASDCDFFESKKWTVDTDGENVTVHLNCKEHPSLNEINLIAYELLDVVNSMEAFSVYFTSKVADESVAYSTLGHTFINTAEVYMPWLILNYKSDGSFSNLVKLYVLWKNRKKQEQMKLKLDILKKEMDKNIVKNEKPIGV